MKKIKFLILLVILLFPSVIKAYGIENFYINATIENNGDLTVEEYFYLNGDYNGFERILEYRNSNAFEFDPNLSSYGGSSLHNGDGITIEEVRGIPIDASYDFTEKGKEFDKVSSASKGDYGVYTTNYKSNGVSVLIYNPDSYNNAFYVKYKISNMAILHEDVAELGWNIVGNQLSESVGYLRAVINIPGNKDVRVWAHGPLNGESKILSKDKLEISIRGLNSHTAIDARCTFDKSVISSSLKKSGVKALDKILKYEESKAEQANYQRKQKDKQYIEEAERALSACEGNPRRLCYNDAYSKVSYVLDKDKKAEFQKRLDDLEVLVIQKEEENAKRAVEYAETFPYYNNLKSARESVAILTNKELKQSLIERLDKVEVIVKEKEQRIDIYLSIGVSALIIGIIATAIVTYKKTGKDDPSEFDEHYLRDFPDDFSPATVEYLMNGVITNRSVSAEILNMIYKKLIIVESNPEKKNDYIFKLNIPESPVLTNKETYLKKLLFGDASTVTLKEFKRRAKTSYSSFLSSWNSFINQAYSEAETRKLYFFPEEKKKKKTISKALAIIILVALFIFAIVTNVVAPLVIGSVILSILGFGNATTYNTREHVVAKRSNRFKRRAYGLIILSIITACVLAIASIIISHYKCVAPIFGGGALLIGIISISLVSSMKKRNTYGSTEYKKWLAMKNFMSDFGNLSEKELPEIALWEKYLVYATVLGCAAKLQKTMEVKLKDMDLDMNDTFSDILLMNTINNTVNRAINTGHSSAVSAKRAHDYASSSSGGGGSWSSGSGGGGGFSSGGGSFGGGGGGGRF